MGNACYGELIGALQPPSKLSEVETEQLEEVWCSDMFAQLSNAG